MYQAIVIKYTSTIGLFLLVCLSSCGQIQKENIESEPKIKNPIDAEAEATHAGNSLQLDSIIKRLPLRSFPVIDTTNYNNSSVVNHDTKEVVAALKLEKIYPDFFRDGYSFYKLGGL